MLSRTVGRWTVESGRRITGISPDFLQDPYVSGPFGFPGCGYTYYGHVGNEDLTDGSR